MTEAPLAEHTHDGLRVAVDDSQQDAASAIWNTAPLFSILYGTRVEAEAVRKLLATVSVEWPNESNVPLPIPIRTETVALMNSRIRSVAISAARKEFSGFQEGAV